MPAEESEPTECREDPDHEDFGVGKVDESKDPVHKGVAEGYECVDGTED